MSAAERAYSAFHRLADGTVAFLAAVHRNYQEAHDGPAVADRAIEIEANRIEDESPLTWRESVIAAARDADGDVSDEQLCRIMGRSIVTVERARERLRQRERDVDRVTDVLAD